MNYHHALWEYRRAALRNLFPKPRQDSIEKALGGRFSEFQRIKSFSFCTDPEYPNGESFSAVTWNIKHALNIDEIIAALLNHTDLKDSDIFLLQEVDRFSNNGNGGDLAEKLSRETSYNGVYVTEFFKTAEGPRAETGNMILTRYPIIDSSSLILPSGYDWRQDTHEPGRLGERHAVEATIIINGREVRVYDAHLELVTDQKHRASQMGTILNDAGRFPDTTIILGGDFNVYSEFEKSIELLRRAGFDLRPYERNNSATLNDGLIHHFPLTPDFIVTRLLRSLSYKVIHVDGDPSDHNPIKGIYTFISQK